MRLWVCHSTTCEPQSPPLLGASPASSQSHREEKMRGVQALWAQPCAGPCAGPCAEGPGLCGEPHDDRHGFWTGHPVLVYLVPVTPAPCSKCQRPSWALSCFPAGAGGVLGEGPSGSEGVCVRACTRMREPEECILKAWCPVGGKGALQACALHLFPHL